jgi:hypothetical protein
MDEAWIYFSDLNRYSPLVFHCKFSYFFDTERKPAAAAILSFLGPPFRIRSCLGLPDFRSWEVGDFYSIKKRCANSNDFNMEVAKQGVSKLKR